MSTLAHALERCDRARTRAFEWRDALSVPARVALALSMAALTGLMAQLRLPIPGTPVPVTGQVFAVLLSGVLLGGGYGALSQTVYVGAGAAGLPWFAGLSGGQAVILGVTGGYLVGFIPAALLIGLVAQRHPLLRRPIPMALVMLAGVAVIYLGGAVQFSAFLHTGLRATLAGAVLPFIAWDVAKALLAASIAAALLPKAPRDGS